jgi:hypothetical protein
MDTETANLLRNIEAHSGRSRSELIRNVLKFYDSHRILFENNVDESIYTRAEMLSAGEHIILDIDHWILFLIFIESHPEKERFWELHRRVCHSHAERFKNDNYDIDGVLKRFEMCNLFKLNKISDTDFTLVLNSHTPLKFLKVELEEIFSELGLNVDLRGYLSKLSVKIFHEDNRQ